MSSNLLVTGGTGLVGNALRRYYPKAIFMNRKEADLRDLCQVRNSFSKYKPRYVIHLAAKVAGVKTNLEKIADMFTTNTQINTNVLNTAQEFKVEKLITVLSNCVFQEKPPKPPTEKDIHIGMPFQGHIGYGYAKRMLDLQIHLLHKQYGCNYTSITPVTIFGPYDNWNSNDGHVVGALIDKCYRSKVANSPLEVWGSGNALRQFVYSFDVAQILKEIMEKYSDPETIIIAPDTVTSIKTIAETIAKIMDFRGPIIFDTSKPEGEIKRVLDNSKFRSIFPNYIFTPLEKALQETIQWFISNQATIQNNAYANT